MTVREPGVGRPDHTRVPVNRTQGDVQISHDLAESDFVIPDDTELDNPPFIGGASQSILGVESTDEENFEIVFEYGTIDADGDFTVDFRFDQGDDSRLTGDNKYIIQIRPIRDRVRITVSDVSGNSPNTIRGGLNSS